MKLEKISFKIGLKDMNFLLSVKLMKGPCQLNWQIVLNIPSTSAFIANNVFDCCFPFRNGFDKGTNKFTQEDFT